MRCTYCDKVLVLSRFRSGNYYICNNLCTKNIYYRVFLYEQKILGKLSIHSFRFYFKFKNDIYRLSVENGWLLTEVKTNNTRYKVLVKSEWDECLPNPSIFYGLKTTNKSFDRLFNRLIKLCIY